MLGTVLLEAYSQAILNSDSLSSCESCKQSEKYVIIMY